MNRPHSESVSPAEQRYVSTAQVAHALGVSVTTVKRWVDDDILPAHRTVGGHRKLLMTDVLRAAREGNLPQADLSRLLARPSDPATADPAVVYPQLVEAIHAADGDLIRSLIHSSYRAGLPFEAIADRIIAPAMAHVGHAWEAGRLDVSHEHRISQAVISALYELRAFLRTNTERNRPVALGGAPEHDHYVLPSLVAKLTLLDCGWEAVNLGPHTPASAFRAAIDELNPLIVWVAVGHLEDEARFLADYRELYEYADAHGVAVAVGGRAVTERLRVKMPYTTFGDGMAHLASFARSLHRRPQRPKRGRPPADRPDAEAN